MQIEKKIKKFQRSLKKNKIDLFLTLNKSNVFYLFDCAMEAYACITQDSAVLLVSPLYLNETKRKYKDSSVVVKELKTHVYDMVFSIAKKAKYSSLTLDVASLNYENYKRFERFALENNCNIKTAKGLVEQLRFVKNKVELNNMRKAAKVSLDAFNFIEPLLHTGVKERSLRIELEAFLKSHGDLALAFDPIIASGAASANPHYTACDGVIAKNKPVLIDQGIKVNGYCSDLTRMFFVGKPTATYTKVADVVRKAHEKAIKAIKPGAMCSAVDKAAREHIEKNGYGKYFVHTTGHGVGIDVHEAPALSARSEVILEPGMVVTVEPAIYLPNKFGFREENMVLVTKTGYEVLG